MRNVSFSSSDFELFDPDITPQDYEFYQKHKDALKSLLEDQTQERKQKFVEAFRDFSLNHGCMKDFPLKNEHSFIVDVIENISKSFVEGKASKGKYLVTDAVCLLQNRGMIQNLGGSSSCAKDPFVHKDTRDVFRRLFGEPDQESRLKAVVVYSLYVKFGGSVCRYLRRWLEAGKLDELGVTSLSQVPVSNSESTQSVSTKEDNTTKASSTEVVKPSGGPMVAVATIGRNGGASDSSEEEEEEEEEEDSWEAKVIRGITSVLTDRGGASAIDFMEVYKRDKDGSYRRLREQFHLGKPHPNVEFEERCRKKEEEVIEGSRLREVIMKDYAESCTKKKHACANCRQVERYAGTFKKCQRCSGKGTRFYCSRKCQGEDWVSRHRQDHSTMDLPS
ncbi:unnamed protein product [Pocillopora meandrina]|uniref:MYND-type domain-containing protein n=1 Tax=Pocillopora meandrina TaxID=46732 RepID=A0AAU9VSL5_9CNID|nr:unnamed protein product [Pocillopora meandrina]